MPIRSQAPVEIHRRAREALLAVAPIKLAIPYRKQLQDQWCWAACCQMLLAFLQHPDVQQCQMAQDQFGGDCCVTPGSRTCNQGCFPENAYDRYGVSVTFAEQNGQSDIDRELEAGRPIELYYLWSNGGAHVALITGRNADGTYDVHDPYFGLGPRAFSRIATAYGKGRWDSSYINIGAL